MNKLIQLTGLLLLFAITGCSQLITVQPDEKVVIFANEKSTTPNQFLDPGEKYDPQSIYYIIKPNEFYVVENGIKIPTASTLKGAIPLYQPPVDIKDNLFIIVDIVNAGKIKTDKMSIVQLFSQSFKGYPNCYAYCGFRIEVAFNDAIRYYSTDYNLALKNAFIKLGRKTDYSSNYELIGNLIKDEMNSKNLPISFSQVVVKKFKVYNYEEFNKYTREQYKKYYNKEMPL